MSTVDRRQLLCGGCATFALACSGSTDAVAPQATGDTGTPGGTGPGPEPIDTPLENPVYPCDQPIVPDGPGWRGFKISEHPELDEVGGWMASATAGGKLFIIAHVQEGCYVAADRRCTHQGVIMDYVPDRGQFVCPLHGSLFSWTGEKVGGPAPTPIQVYFAGREGDTVWVLVTDD
ncbi:MAG: Rieske (2Fe-2S) protein [Myxococcota bacterium]